MDSLALRYYVNLRCTRGFPGGSGVKNPPANAGDAGDGCSASGLGRSPGEGNGNPLQYSFFFFLNLNSQTLFLMILELGSSRSRSYSCLNNLMDRGAWPSSSSMEATVAYNNQEGFRHGMQPEEL